MIRLLLIFIFLAPFSAFSCDADPPPVALEFLKAKHVFFGQATSKVYAKDSLTYTVSFTVEQHFKEGGSLPETLAFTLPAEGEITGSYSSCDFGVLLGRKWLIYAYTYNGILTFSYYGSNSKPTESLDAIPKQELEILNSGHEIDYRNIIFDESLLKSPTAVTYVGPSPKIQLHSLLTHIDNTKYRQTSRLTFENFIAGIDSSGNIMELFIPDRRAKHVFQAVYDVQATVWTPLKELSSLQFDLLQALKASGQWKPARFMGKSVNSQVFFQVYIDEQGKVTTSAFY
ncbi:hypothetical protein [Pontibacter indicus]|uniref:Beta-lactamase-inhibitor-like, PepSY-like n=1 Tax=Pontibacter indicus TaxID=1317125 RepID=A0A1R3XRV6_9BACT|nr:hypothetical protein [Pontibacter indicus]SIT93752.1 hypothetical protein SAMN05444128_3185 [Pontibacter indicus]